MAEMGNSSARSASEEYRARMLKCRTAKNLTHASLASLLPCSESLMGAVERGTRLPTESFTRQLERALGLNGELLELLPAIRGLGPRWFRKWPAAEQAARSIRLYELALIPGLLQTADYARAIFQGEPGAYPGEVEKAVNDRLQRQAILAKANPPTLSVILDDSVLRREIGGCEVMRRQLEYLLDMMDRPCITVRVIPLSSGATAGLGSSFAIADTGDGTQVGYIDSVEIGEVTHQTDVIQKLSERWELLSALAQPTYETEKIIRKVLE
ncbi:Scr1 family TA system antitoxin-like transcriptional regulator [Nonomuraea purpurea]|uniref:Scr1 family TA system antitoxin-like transcriptional regulator n=1 Tax=Nonomuraea purpurea TaxID=1849276 RepID=A0ABV8GSS9_9ACTN